MLPKEELTAVILAGGESRRMGTNKALLKLGDKTFVAHILETVKPLVSQTILIANTEDYNDLGVPVFEDLVKNSGPVGGIHAAMFYAVTPYILVLSCDIPLVNRALLDYLIEQSIPTDLNIISIENKKQPLTAIYKRTAMPFFAEALELQHLKLRLLLDKLEGNDIACPTDFIPCLANINTPKELEQLIHENRN